MSNHTHCTCEKYPLVDGRMVTLCSYCKQEGERAELSRNLPWAQQPVYINTRFPSQRRFDR